MASERILIVDDEPYVRTLMAAMLEKSNYTPVLASNGLEAIEHLEHDPPYDLILSDIVMNGLDGIGLLERIREAQPDTPMVMVTAIHDVGVAISAMRKGAYDYLLKPGKLDAEEQRVMREHCARGYQILRKIPFLEEAADIVYAHQEHYDGNGYPRNLKGEEIPLGARIFAIADTIDAITSDRPYRKARSYDVARMEVEKCAGTQFDPNIVEVFLGLPDSLWEDLRGEMTRHPRFSPLSFAGAIEDLKV